MLIFGFYQIPDMRPLLYFAFAIILAGCGEGESDQIDRDGSIPSYIDSLENLSVFTPGEQNYDTLRLIREQEFGSNDEIFMKGYIGEIAVDDKDRVYIEEFGPTDEAGIHVFNPDGSYLRKLAGHGKGPGEFTGIRAIKFWKGTIHVYGSQDKIAVFSTEDFSLLREELFRRNPLIEHEELASIVPSGDLRVLNDSTYLMDFQRHAMSNDFRKILYYRLADDGKVIPGRVLTQLRFRYVVSDQSIREGAPLPLAMPFSRQSLLANSRDGLLFTNWTEDFLIKVYNHTGEYQRAIFYPYRKSPLDVDELNLSEGREMLIQEKREEMPRTWPAVHAMTVDDQNRLWVFTITDSDSSYGGWLLQQNGELIARFSILGDRSRRSVFAPSFRAIVQNGYLYTKEQNEGSLSNPNKVFRYRIERE